MATTYTLVIGNDPAIDETNKLKKIVNKLNVDPIDPDPGGSPPDPNVQFYWLIDILSKTVKAIENLEDRVEALE